MFKKVLVATTFAGIIGALPLPAAAVYVQIAPPPPRVEPSMERRAGFIWVGGYWEWRRGKHVWIPGRYVVARPGYRYAAPAWVQRNNQWYFERGRWNRGDRDRDGVPDRFDKYPNNPNRR